MAAPATGRGAALRTAPGRLLHRARATWRRWKREDAITPVVGTSMILVITVLGMAAVLFWGTPTLQRIQDRGSVVGMEGEFDELRRASLELSVPDASRIPTVVLEDGELALEDGTRIMIAIPEDPNYTGCNLYASGWETSPSNQLTIHWGSGACEPTGGILNQDTCEDCLTVEQFTGTSPTTAPGLTYSASGNDGVISWDSVNFPDDEPDFGTGNWVITLTDTPTDEVLATVWIVEQKRIAWHLSTQVSDVDLYLEGGAIFETDSGSFFLHRPAAIREEAFGSSDYVVRLVTLFTNSGDSGSFGRGSPEVLLSLVGNHVRVSTSDATGIRYGFSGDVAEAWCRSFLIRNDALPSTKQYVEESGMECTSDVPHVRYQYIDSGVQTFPLEFLHVRILSSIRA